MELKQYRPEDCDAVMRLFRETIHTINAADYSPEQLDAWAPETPDTTRWQTTLSAHDTLLAWDGDTLMGFADLDGNYLDRLYVSKKHQRQGVAAALTKELERHALERGKTEIETEASITARPFFESRGYTVAEEQNKLHNGVIFLNYIMRKKLRG